MVGTFIISLLSTIVSMISSAVHGNTIQKVNREVKIYLINVHIVQNQIDVLNHTKKEKETIYWLKKYNFVSLLNIPEAMEKYGPLIYL